MQGYFPQDFVAYGDPFDVTTLLAMVKRVSTEELIAISDAYWDVPTPERQVVITAPHSRVNKIFGDT